MCLRDADGQIAQTVPLEGVELLGGGAAVVDAVGAVHPARHGLDLLAQRGLERGQRPVGRCPFARRLEHRLGEVERSAATVCDVRRDRRPHATPACHLLDHCPLAGVVRREAVDGDDGRHAVHGDVLDLLPEVGGARGTSSGFSASRSSGSGRPAAIRYRPECAFSARTVATTTPTSGTSPDVRHLMLKNRSAPMSAPKPASVTSTSPVRMPMRSASTEELPVAMLPKGPACTSAGVPSSVWSRFGLTASRRIVAIAPAARRSLAVTGSPPRAQPPTTRRSRAARSGRDVDNASRAMTSDAAVMSNPLWRGTPSSRPPRPTTMLRRARSLTSRTRGHVIDDGSIPSGLRWYSELSTIAASRLCAAVTAWKSPVRCRFMSS